MVEIALHGDRRTDALDDHPGHLDDPLTITEPGLDGVADDDRGRRLRHLPVDLDVSGPACACGISAGLGQADRPQPLVDPGAGLEREVESAAMLQLATRATTPVCELFLANWLTFTQCVI